MKDNNAFLKGGYFKPDANALVLDDQTLGFAVNAKDIHAVGDATGVEAGLTTAESLLEQQLTTGAIEAHQVLAFALNGAEHLAVGGIGVEAHAVFGGVVDTLRFCVVPVHHGHTIQVEAAALAIGGIGVHDDIAVLVEGGKIGIVGANHINHAHIDDAVQIDAGAVGQQSQVEGGAIAHAVFAGKAVDESGIHYTVRS